ncbi:hypothetical protein GCM10022419_129710 [Nonomuraea rosea]|uniref:Uncharacterized protein n=1 Tax=Nonomuraea rosea TaxID=638574 RepID=A0ABP6ZYB4_9ACTN
MPTSHAHHLANGPGFRAAGPAVAFELIESAQARWGAGNAPRLAEREPATAA